MISVIYPFNMGTIFRRQILTLKESMAVDTYHGYLFHGYLFQKEKNPFVLHILCKNISVL